MAPSYLRRSRCRQHGGGGGSPFWIRYTATPATFLRFPPRSRSRKILENFSANPDGPALPGCLHFAWSRERGPKDGFLPDARSRIRGAPNDAPRTFSGCTRLWPRTSQVSTPFATWTQGGVRSASRATKAGVNPPSSMTEVPGAAPELREAAPGLGVRAGTCTILSRRCE